MCYIKSIIFGIGLIEAVIFKLSDGTYIQGEINSVKDWTFVARFCFLSSGGQFKFKTKHPEAYAPQSILLYYDIYDQWPSVYPSTLSCAEKTSVPHLRPDQMVTLSGSPYCQPVLDSSGKVDCSGTKSFSSSRERWWFIAVSFCQPPFNNITGIRISYELLLLNGNGFHRHFSADEFYILEVDISFLIATFVLVVMSIYVAVKLHDNQMFHSTFKLFLASLLFELVHLIVMCSVYGQYSNDGIEQYGVKVFGRVLEAIGLVIFLLMLILMAKGFTITRGRISTSGAVKLGLFIVVYAVVYAVLFFYEADLFDPGLVLYIYESPPGYGLLAMRLIAWLWFCYGIFFTMKHYPERNAFYLPFHAIFTFWFWAGPCVILAANFALIKSIRATVVNGVERSISFLGFAVFLFLTWPSRANQNFPYHLRTTQIDVINSPSSDTESSDDESIPDDVVTFTDLATMSGGPTPSRQHRKPDDPDSFNDISDGAFPAATDPWTASGHDTPALFVATGSSTQTTAGRRVNRSSPSGPDALPVNAVSDPFCTTNGRSVARPTVTSTLFTSGLSSSVAAHLPVISTSADWTVDGVSNLAASRNLSTSGNAYNNGDIPAPVSTQQAISRPSRQSSADERQRSARPSSRISEVSDPFCTVRPTGFDSPDTGVAGTRPSVKSNSVPVGSDNTLGAITNRPSGFNAGIDPFCTVRSHADSDDVRSAGPRTSVKEKSALGSSLLENPTEVSMLSNLDEPRATRSRRKKKQETSSASDAGDVISNVSDMSDSRLIAGSKSSLRNLNNGGTSTPSILDSTDANRASRGNQLPGLQLDSPPLDREDGTGNSAGKKRKKKKKKSRSASNDARSSDLGRLDESEVPGANTADSQSPARTAEANNLSIAGEELDHHLPKSSAWS